MGLIDFLWDQWRYTSPMDPMGLIFENEGQKAPLGLVFLLGDFLGIKHQEIQHHQTHQHLGEYLWNSLSVWEQTHVVFLFEGVGGELEPYRDAKNKVPKWCQPVVAEKWFDFQDLKLFAYLTCIILHSPFGISGIWEMVRPLQIHRLCGFFPGKSQSCPKRS